MENARVRTPPQMWNFPQFFFFDGFPKSVTAIGDNNQLTRSNRCGSGNMYRAADNPKEPTPSRSGIRSKLDHDGGGGAVEGAGDRGAKIFTITIVIIMIIIIRAAVALGGGAIMNLQPVS